MAKGDEKIEVPAGVYESLAWVRKIGVTNMFDVFGVAKAMELGGDEVFAQWVIDNRKRYGTVLTQFGEWLEEHPSEQ